MAIDYGTEKKKPRLNPQGGGGYSMNSKPPTAPMRGGGIAALAAQQASRQPAPGNPPIPTQTPRSLLGTYAQRATKQDPQDMKFAGGGGGGGGVPHPTPGQVSGTPQAGLGGIPVQQQTSVGQQQAPQTPTSPTGLGDPTDPGSRSPEEAEADIQQFQLLQALQQAGDASYSVRPETKEALWQATPQAMLQKALTGQAFDFTTPQESQMQQALAGQGFDFTAPDQFSSGAFTEDGRWVPGMVKDPRRAPARPGSGDDRRPSTMATGPQGSILDQLYSQIQGEDFGIGDEAQELEKNIWNKATDLASQQAEKAAMMGVGGAGLTQAGFGDIMGKALGEARQLQFDTANVALQDEMAKISLYLATEGKNLDRDLRKQLEEKKLALQKEQNDLLAKQYGKSDFNTFVAEVLGIADLNKLGVGALKELHEAWGDGGYEGAKAVLAVWDQISPSTAADKAPGFTEGEGGSAGSQFGVTEGWNQPPGNQVSGVDWKKWLNPEEIDPAQGPDAGKAVVAHMNTLGSKFSTGDEETVKMVEQMYDDVYAWLAANPDKSIDDAFGVFFDDMITAYGSAHIGGRWIENPIWENMYDYLYDKMHADGTLQEYYNTHYKEDVDAGTGDNWQPTRGGQNKSALLGKYQKNDEYYSPPYEDV